MSQRVSVKSNNRLLAFWLVIVGLFAGAAFALVGAMNSLYAGLKFLASGEAGEFTAELISQAFHRFILVGVLALAGVLVCVACKVFRSRVASNGLSA